MDVKDSNGSFFTQGDKVAVIKDLNVRDSSSVINLGTVVKKIRLSEDAGGIEGRV